MSTSGADGTGAASEPFDGRAQYRDTRDRLVALGRTLDEEQGAMLVPATPAWSIKDVYAHLTGAAADLLAGNLEGVTTDPWTEAQVAARRGHTIAEVLDEMESLGEQMDSLIGNVGEAMDVRLFIDQWTHEQDIRGALGAPGGVDSPIVAHRAPAMARSWVRRSARAGLPPLEVVLDGVPVAEHADPNPDRPGDGHPLTFAVDGYEAMRVGLGRRSRRQLAELDWRGEGDPASYFEHLVTFTIADRDVIDAR